MKHFVIIFCLMFSAVVLAAGPKGMPSPDVAKAIQGYENGLRHSNAGLVESTILNVLKYKCRYPQLDLSSLHQPLAELSKEGKTADIRQKADLVYKLLKNPDLIPSCSKELYDDPASFFKVLAIGMQLARVDLQQSEGRLALTGK